MVVCSLVTKPFFLGISLSDKNTSWETQTINIHRHQLTNKFRSPNRNQTWWNSILKKTTKSSRIFVFWRQKKDFNPPNIHPLDFLFSCQASPRPGAADFDCDCVVATPLRKSNLWGQSWVWLANFGRGGLGAKKIPPYFLCKKNKKKRLGWDLLFVFFSMKNM